MEAATDNVVFLKRPKRFTLEEARGLLDRVKELTDSAVADVRPYVEELSLPIGSADRESLSRKFQARVAEWADEIRKLGAHPKGLWLVDFDCGTGFYCWRYKEPELSFFHGYPDGFTERKPIQ